MNNLIVIENYTMPDDPGYGDILRYFKDDKLLYACPASICPNPRQPKIKGGKHWTQAYGLISHGRYQWKCVQHWKYGKCLLIDEGKELPARFPNVNHDNKRIISKVYLHCGYTASWRGSAGCLTVPPVYYLPLVHPLCTGSTGTIHLVDRLPEHPVV